MKKRLKKYIVAEGETTGHSHRLEAVKDTGYFDIVNQAAEVIIDFIKGQTKVVHEEHKGVLFLEGNIYHQWGLREIHPLENKIRAVID